MKNSSGVEVGQRLKGKGCLQPYLISNAAQPALAHFTYKSFYVIVSGILFDQSYFILLTQLIDVEDLYNSVTPPL